MPRSHPLRTGHSRRFLMVQNMDTTPCFSPATCLCGQRGAQLHWPPPCRRYPCRYARNPKPQTNSATPPARRTRIREFDVRIEEPSNQVRIGDRCGATDVQVLLELRPHLLPDLLGGALLRTLAIYDPCGLPLGNVHREDPAHRAVADLRKVNVGPELSLRDGGERQGESR
jgi:hypothetical protein